MPLAARHVRVHRTARVIVLGNPAGGARELWIACHGYGQLAESFARALAPLDDGSRVVAVPEGLSRFYLDDPRKRHGPDSPVGASWMTREDREVEISDYVGYLDVVAAELMREIGDAVPIVGLGFSQGVATIARWAATGTPRCDRVILWGGSLPPDLPDTDLGPFKGAAVTLVGGEHDQLISSAALERDRATLAERGIGAAVMRHPGGHALDSNALLKLAAGERQ